MELDCFSAFPLQLQDLGLSELSESITTHSLFSGLQYFVAMLLLSSFLSCVSSHNLFTVIWEEFGGKDSKYIICA